MELSPVTDIGIGICRRLQKALRLIIGPLILQTLPSCGLVSVWQSWEKPAFPGLILVRMAHASHSICARHRVSFKLND